MKSILNATEVDVRRFFYLTTFSIIVFGLIQMISGVMPEFISKTLEVKTSVPTIFFSNPLILPLITGMLTFLTLSNVTFSYSRTEVAKKGNVLESLEEVGEKLYLIAFNIGSIILLSVVASFFNKHTTVTHNLFDVGIANINFILKYIALASGFLFSFSILRKLVKVFLLMSSIAADRFMPDAARAKRIQIKEETP